eukprot:m.200114 g.200114  ORF g.200114 m.200114 type:complete len:102 (-) comp25196_c1_seq2:839-1144(-)
MVSRVGLTRRGGCWLFGHYIPELSCLLCSLWPVHLTCAVMVRVGNMCVVGGANRVWLAITDSRTFQPNSDLHADESLSLYHLQVPPLPSPNVGGTVYAESH